MILDEIVANKKIDVEHKKTYITIDSLNERISRLKPAMDFACALKGSGDKKDIRIIAEIKKASPSKGIIRADFMPYEIARTYQSNGAAAISILTEEKYFQGNIDYLTSIKANVKIPVLRKDFIFDEFQVVESRAARADAILLIAAILDRARLKGLMDLAESYGMASLVEVHDVEELEVAVTAGAKLVGINNRDLKTFKTDLNVTKELVKYVPKDVVLVSESGINTIDDILSLSEYGVDAFLIGEALMREPEIGKKLRELRGVSFKAPDPIIPPKGK